MAMGRATRSTMFGVLFTVAALGMNITAAGAQEAIRPNQHFIGLVNGSNVAPVVNTVCPGPTWPGRTGPVAGGQTMSVARVANGPGYTGPLSQVYAWFDQEVVGFEAEHAEVHRVWGFPGDPHRGPGALRRHRSGAVQSLPVSGALRLWLHPGSGQGQVRQHRSLRRFGRAASPRLPRVVS